MSERSSAPRAHPNRKNGPRPLGSRHRAFRPSLQRLEGRRLLDATIFQQNGQVAVVRSDALPDAAPITILRAGAPAATGDQLAISYAVDRPADRDFREMLVIDTNGVFRLRHPDGLQPPGSEDPFGTSLKLPPSLIVDGPRFFLTMRVERIDLITDQSASGILRLHMSGRPANGSGAGNPNVLPVAVTWDLTLFPPSHSEAAALLTTTATFEGDVTLSDAHRAGAEAFRAAEFSSSNVVASNTTSGIATHDADQFRATTSAGATVVDVDLNAAPRNQLFSPNGRPFNGGIELNQRTPAPLNGDSPNIRIHLLPDGAEYRAQGFLTQDPSIDENSDNVGAWISRSFGSSLISAGSRFAWTAKIAARDEPTIFANTEPVVDAGPDINTTSLTLSRVGRFVDPDAADSWTATVTYGDGTGTLPLALNPDKTFRLEHTYARSAPYRVTVTVRDDENGVGTGSFTALVGLTGQVPSAPTALTARAVSSSRVELAWRDNATNETGYRVERRADGSDWIPIAATLPPGSTRVADTSVAAGTTYVYRVFAFNALLNSGFSNEATVTTPGGSTPPPQPSSQSVQFDAARYSVTEGRRRAAVVVVRTGDLSRPAMVRFSTAPATARAGADYRPVSLRVRFGRGQASRTISIPILDDRRVEADETVRLLLSLPSGNTTLGSQDTAELIILDNDR